ncbi:MAG TPA: cupin domain-containing protein [Solirubrobacterales bacterium]|nr:cupin domain-containing protein [Solirubrobacterales bacterium]
MSTTKVKSLKLTPIESVEIRSADADQLEVLVTYLPGDPPPKHFHPEQDERFEVLEGTVRVELDGGVRDLRIGDSLEIPRGAVHRLWNPEEEAARAIWQTTPAGRTEQWFRALDALNREGPTGKNGQPGPLAYGVMLSEYRDVFRLAGPDFLQRPALGLLATLGRARGYSATPSVSWR